MTRRLILVACAALMAAVAAPAGAHAAAINVTAACLTSPSSSYNQIAKPQGLFIAVSRNLPGTPLSQIDATATHQGTRSSTNPNKAHCYHVVTFNSLSGRDLVFFAVNVFGSGSTITGLTLVTRTCQFPQGSATVAC